MRVIELHEFGPADNLRYATAADPEPGPGQVRILVKAAGVHFIDTAIRSGASWSPLPELPTVPGREVAGIVDALGPDVSDTWLGKRVVTHLGNKPGGYAELALGDVDSLFELPDNLDFEPAVAMIGTGRTTMGIIELAQITPEDVVLILAAAGGVGNLLIQHSRNIGATVIGAAGGPDKQRRVRQLGADLAVDYSLPGWTDSIRQALAGRPVTILLEGVGGQLSRDAFDLLGKGSRILVYGFSSGEAFQPSDDQLADRAISFDSALMPKHTVQPKTPRQLQEAALAAAAKDELVPAWQSFALSDAAKAHAALENRETMGKVVLIP